MVFEINTYTSQIFYLLPRFVSISGPSCQVFNLATCLFYLSGYQLLKNLASNEKYFDELVLSRFFKAYFS